MEIKSMLDYLIKEQIFSTNVADDKLTVQFWDACDYYFHTRLNKSEMEQLIQELIELKDTMKTDG